MKEKNWLPRYKLSDRMVVFVADIVEGWGDFSQEKRPAPKKSAVVAAFLQSGRQEFDVSPAQVEQILKQPTAVGDEKAVRWVQNGARVWNKFKVWQPYQMASLTKAHQLLYDGITVEAGCFRTENLHLPGSEGKKRSYVAPTAKRVPDFMGALLQWGEQGKKSPAHPLIQAAVMGYALEAIQPFAVGNRAMSWLWSGVLLTRWKSNFPIVDFWVHLGEQEAAYEKALKKSIQEENAAAFIEFILGCCYRIVKPATAPASPPTGESVQALLNLLGDQALSTKEMMEGLGLKHRPSFRDHYLLPALQLGVVEMTIPDKPNSCRQKYRRS